MMVNTLLFYIWLFVTSMTIAGLIVMLLDLMVMLGTRLKYGFKTNVLVAMSFPIGFIIFWILKAAVVVG